MHIPNQMLNGSICPVTAAISTIGIGLASYFAIKSKKKPKTSYIAAIASFIFAAQMINFPVQNGTSGHLIGATLASTLLGMPLGILVMSLVVTIQCLIFADGGFSVLGANILNMAIIGSIAGGIIHKFLFQKETQKNSYCSSGAKRNRELSPQTKRSSSFSTCLAGSQASSKTKLLSYLGLASWFSVMLAALACSLELALSKTIELSKVLPAMLSVHALIGIGEALITVGAFYLFSSKAFKKSKRFSFGFPLVAAAIIGLMLSPFASSYPDGLEWAAERYEFLHEAAPTFVTPLPDYTIPLIENEIISTGLAGLLGVAITFLFVLIITKIILPRSSR